MIALGLTRKSLFPVKWELMKPTRRPSVSLVTEAGLLLWISSPLISGGPVFKSAVFSTSLSLPPIVNEGCRLLWESVGNAYLLSNHFDSKQSREAADLPLTRHPYPSLTTFAFRSREVRRLLLDLDPYGGTEPLGMFPLFLTRTADVMALCLSVVFRGLVRLGMSSHLISRSLSMTMKVEYKEEGVCNLWLYYIKKRNKNIIHDETCKVLLS